MIKGGNSVAADDKGRQFCERQSQHCSDCLIKSPSVSAAMVSAATKKETLLRLQCPWWILPVLHILKLKTQRGSLVTFHLISEEEKKQKKKKKPLDFSYNCKAMLSLQTCRAAAVKSVISNENKNKKESRRKEPLQI